MSDRSLPPGLRYVRTTPTFTRTTVPAGLLRSHRVADGTWARLVVASGELEFAFEDGDEPGHRLGAGDEQVIPPGRLHHLRIEAEVSFAIDFYTA